MKPEDRIKRALIAIMRHPKFCAYSGVLACGKRTITTAVPTAATDGFNTMFNPDFVDKLSDPELRLLVLHEALHIAFRHLRVWKPLWDQHRMLANVAADHFVNLGLILDDNGEGFLKMPAMGVQPDMKYKGWSVRMIFDDLMQQAQQQGGGGGGGDPDDPDDGGGFDQHDWESAAAQDADAAQAQAQEIDRALRQGEMIAKKRGQGRGSSALLAELLQPKVDWRQQLREFVQEQCQGRDESTWRKPNRRYIGDDVYMPSMISETMGELVVGMDTSGSVYTSGTVSQFASEIAAIVEQVKPSKVRVLYWDVDVRAEQVFEDGQFAFAALKPSGGGGTDGSAVSRYLAENHITPAAIVQLTDGYVGDWGTQIAPTLWVITERHISAPLGRTVHMDV